MMDFVVNSYFPIVQMIEDDVLSMEHRLLDAFLSRDEVTLCSAFIRSQGGDCQVAVHGMMGAWSRSFRALSNSSQTPLG